MYYNNNQYGELPELTFVSADNINTNLESAETYKPFVFLRFKPQCACGKEFRSSGEKKAQERIAQHTGYKKYAKCTPTVEEMTFNLPEFVTISQIFGTKANSARATKLREQIVSAEFWEEMKWNSRQRRRFNVIITEFGEIFNTNTGEYFIPEKVPSKMDGYQIEKNVNLKVVIVDKSKIRSVKQGAFQVCEITVQDDNGDKIPLTLWNDQTGKFNKGDSVVIRNAYIKEAWKGGYELALYKNASSIEVVQN